MLRLEKSKKKTRGNIPSVDTAQHSSPDISTQIEEIVVALKESTISKALTLTQSLIQRYPESPNVRIIAAGVELAVGDRNAAKAHYDHLISISPHFYDGYYNLALILHGEGNSAKAAHTLFQASNVATDLISHWNDCGFLYRASGSYTDALKCYRHALEIEPTNSIALDAISEITASSSCTSDTETTGLLFSFSPIHPLTTIAGSEMPSGKRILVVARHQMFIKSLVESLQSGNELLLLTGDSPERIVAGLAWADVAWFDWSDDLLAFATHQKISCPIIARCHSYEVFTEFPTQIDWSKVATVVFVNHSVRELFQQIVKTPVHTEVIANGLNLQTFQFQPEKQQTKQIASVGYINYKKNPALLLHCFKAIHEYDPSYSLHIAGEYQDPRIALYMTHFLQKHPLPVYFDGWVADMPAWYADKSFVISTSLFESFHFSIAEGMSMGLLPLVHDWYGADNLYPENILFSDPADVVRLLRQYEKANTQELRQLARVHVETHFDEKRMLRSMNAVITRTLSQRVNRGTHVAASR
jgi:glycosyltransferase involved in cell wall biosynthesis